MTAKEGGEGETENRRIGEGQSKGMTEGEEKKGRREGDPRGEDIKKKTLCS